MKSLMILVVSVAYITLCGASYHYPAPHSAVPLFNLNEATGRLEFNRAPLASSSHTTEHVYTKASKKEETSHHQSTTTIHHETPVLAQTETLKIPAVPVVPQHPTENVEIPFYETPTIVAESIEFERNMELLQTLCAQRDVITTQIEHITEIQKTSSSVRVEQSDVMGTLLRQREYLNFQINSLVSLLGLETTYNTQFQVLGTSQQAPQPNLPAAPQYVEKKILFFEPTSTVHAIYPPTPVKAQTFHLTSTESHNPVNHPNVLSALEAQRDMITDALSKLSKSQKQDKTNLVDFYTTRRDIIIAQIAQIKELQKGDTSTTTIETSKPDLVHQNVETNVHSTETTSTSGLGVSSIQHEHEKTTTYKPEDKIETITKSEPTTVFVENTSGEQTATTQEADLLAVLMMIRDSLQTQIELLVSNSKHRQELGEDKESLLNTLKAECDVIDLQIAHAMGKFSTKSETTTPKPTSTTAGKIVETQTEQILIPHEQFGISRRYLPTY